MARPDVKTFVAALLALLAGAKSHETPLLRARHQENSVLGANTNGNSLLEGARLGEDWAPVSRNHKQQQLGAKSQDDPGAEGATYQDVPGAWSGEDWAPVSRHQKQQQLGAKSQDDLGAEGATYQDVPGARSREDWAPVSRHQKQQQLGAKSQDDLGAEGATYQDVPGARSGKDWALGAGLRVVAAAYRQCRSGDNLLACLQLRALKAADRALKTDRIPLLYGVELVNTGEARALEAPAVDEERLLREPSRLTSLLLDRAAMFFRTHAVRIDNRSFFADEDPTEEGRGKAKKKLKKLGGLLLLAGALKAGLLALATKGVAVLTVAALTAGTVALVLAAIVGFGSLLGHSSRGHTTYEIVKHPHVSHVKTHSSSHEYVDGHDEEEYGDMYESRVGSGSFGYRYQVPGYLGRPDLRAHPLAYQKQPGAAAAVAKS